jgi:hypothetical protein
MRSMKAVFAAIAIGTGAPALAEDANPTAGKIAMGLQGGLTFAEFHERNTGAGYAFDGKTGWMGGIFMEFGLWTITLRPEVNYVEKKYSVGNLADVKTNRLELNALLKFNPLGPGLISPFLLLGPQWSNHLETTISNRAGATVATLNTGNNWDLAAVGGLGIDFNLAESIALGAQGRYVFGFRDLDDSTVELKTRDVQALLSLTFQDAF